MEEILINQLFAGSYLQEGTNIGHEVINLFKDDNNKNNLFITPSGRIGDHNIKRILFVQNIKARDTMEVVMKAEGLSTLTNHDIDNIYYAGVEIEDIFNKNLYHGEADSTGPAIMATFQARDIRLPKKGRRIIITLDLNYTDEDSNSTVIYLGSDKTKIVGQGMRTYLSEKSYKETYEIVNQLLDDESLWEEKNSTQKMVSDNVSTRSSSSFLEIIRKENDELIMSNLLSYYFSYNRRMFTMFAKEILNIDNFSTTFEIRRESMKQIDLWIRDEHQVLVIENKIKSGLNGITKDGKNQLHKYYDFTEKHIKENRIDKAYYFVFVPNYNSITIDDPVIKDQFKIINYSEIYEFFRINAAEYLNDKYFPDFLDALRKQTMTNSELQFSIMRSRFLEKINQK